MTSIRPDAERRPDVRLLPRRAATTSRPTGPPPTRCCEIFPETGVAAQTNRHFLRRAVRYAAEQGVRQFLDIGAGLPTQDAVHEVVRAMVAPDSTAARPHQPHRRTIGGAAGRLVARPRIRRQAASRRPWTSPRAAAVPSGCPLSPPVAGPGGTTDAGRAPAGGAPMASRPERLLRGGDSPLSASFLELFFDLAFVLALSQLAGHLLHDLTLVGRAAHRPAVGRGLVDLGDHHLVRRLVRPGEPGGAVAAGRCRAGQPAGRGGDPAGVGRAGPALRRRVRLGAHRPGRGHRVSRCAVTRGRGGRCGSSAGSASRPYRGWPVGSCRSGGCRSGCSPSPSTSPAHDSAGPRPGWVGPGRRSCISPASTSPSGTSRS